MSKAVYRLSITTGDPDGVGTEVAAKALSKLKPTRAARFYLWRSPQTPKKHLKLMDQLFERITVTNLDEALSLDSLKPNQLVDINSTLSPAHWVEQTAQRCLKGEFDALVTGPLSKITIREAGFQDLGHTEILKRVAGVQSVFMGFLGQHFHVLSMTGHMPLREVPARLTQETVQEAIRIADDFTRRLYGARRKPLAVVGLNPHAGEKGLIGDEEETAYKGALSAAREKGIKIEGPLVPDAAFFPSQWKKYSFYLCPYHDQALIPFKMIHTQNSGAHITLGLPFIRTSVDHGTAKDIFNKNKANPNSMKDALLWALRLLQARSK